MSDDQEQKHENLDDLDLDKTYQITWTDEDLLSDEKYRWLTRKAKHEAKMANLKYQLVENEYDYIKKKIHWLAADMEKSIIERDESAAVVEQLEQQREQLLAHRGSDKQ